MQTLYAIIILALVNVKITLDRSTDSSVSEASSSQISDEKQSGNWWDSWLSSAKTKVSPRK